jgi:uncharacterized protein with HEPN domain
VIRPAQRLRDCVEHMLADTGRIATFTSGMTEAAFLADARTQDAVIRNLEIIGEAAHNVPRRHAEFANAHPEVPWRRAYETRHAVRHGYFDVDLITIWTTMRDDLPALERQLTAVLSAITDEPA